MRFHEQVHGVYFDDLDAFGILHNARYILYFERTVGSFWKHLGWRGILDDTSNPDQFQLVRANHLEYLRPVIGVGEVRARVWVEKLGRTSLTFGFCLLPLDEDLPYATGTRTMVRIDPRTRKPVEWTENFRKALAPYRKDLPASQTQLRPEGPMPAEDDERA
ncbi:MAG: acyl-CoA thioesterase [Myxococcaceae bacterium]|nr:acyl-CoA thioesterase [Myxococcaceae bacterium]